MEYQTSLVSFFGRITLGFLALCTIYLFFGPPSYEEVDMINSIIYLGAIPLILIPGSILICILVGTPIRAITKIKKWWYERPYIAIAGIIIGLILCYVSKSPSFSETTPVILSDQEYIEKIPNTNILGTGWFVLAFSIIHFYPESLSDFISKKVGSKKRGNDTF